jgi:alkaline phosphatase D
MMDDSEGLKEDDFRMNLIARCFLFLPLFVLLSCAPKNTLGPRDFVRVSENSTKVLFGSCNDQERDQKFWRSLISEKADLMILMGDNVYGKGNNQDSLRKAYARLSRNLDFQRFRETTPLVATWDDHDFGRNDGGADFPHIEDSKLQFLNFWEEPKNSARRTRDGIYDSFVVGPAGSSMQVILLDTRSFRTPLNRVRKTKSGRGPYAPDNSLTATLLGQEQWAWFEKQLQVPADVRFVISSIQVMSDEHGFESWGNFPRERRKLIELLDRHRTKVTVLMSGDRHQASFYERKRSNRPTIHEVTSSPLNATLPSEFQIPIVNPYQDGETIFSANYGVALIDWEKRNLILQLRLADGSLSRQKKIEFAVR